MAGPRFTPSQFVAELKRRRVVRVVVAYVAVVLAVGEAAHVLAPTFDLPGWVTTLVAVLGLLGLPLTIVLAWVFDITPAGVKRTDEYEGELPSLPLLPVSVPLIVVVAALMALLAGAMGWVVFRRS